MTDNTVRVFQDFTQGDDFIINISHNPVFDMTNGSIEVLLKFKENSTTAVLSKVYVVPAGADATAGTVNVPIDKVLTAAVVPGEYFASIKRIDAAGNVVTILRTGKSNARKVTCFKSMK